MVILQLVPTTNFWLQMTFATKILIVALNKTHVRLVTNNKEFLDEKKIQQNTPSSFEWSYTFYHLQLGFEFFGE